MSRVTGASGDLHRPAVPQVADLAAELAAITTRPWTLMEVCGGQTHAIVRWGLDQLLPPGVHLVHGPGCPVCVTPVATIERALALARRPEVILCSYGDMLRVPGAGREDLLSVRAAGGDVRLLTTPLQALALARSHPERQVVFLAVGFETTAPATALLAEQALALALPNLSLLCAHVRVTPAMEAILVDPETRVQGFLAAGHVCAVQGTAELQQLVARRQVPVVVTGFEPLELMRGVLACVRLLEGGRAELGNAYAQVVRAWGNPAAQARLQAVFEVVDRPWRGLGVIRGGGLGLKGPYRALDVERRPALEAPGWIPAAARATAPVQPMPPQDSPQRTAPQQLTALQQPTALQRLTALQQLTAWQQPLAPEQPMAPEPGAASSAPNPPWSTALQGMGPADRAADATAQAPLSQGMASQQRTASQRLTAWQQPLAPEQPAASSPIHAPWGTTLQGMALADRAAGATAQAPLPQGMAPPQVLSPQPGLPPSPQPGGLSTPALSPGLSRAAVAVHGAPLPPAADLEHGPERSPGHSSGHCSANRSGPSVRQGHGHAVEPGSWCGEPMEELVEEPLEDSPEEPVGRCIAAAILRGRACPGECPAFAVDCTPEQPLGAPMVSSEGACAAWYRYRRFDQPARSTKQAGRSPTQA